MLTPSQIHQFETQGYLVVPDLIPMEVMEAVRAEYEALLDELYQGWFAAGAVTVAPEALNFWDKLLTVYRAGCDYFQPMDISLPGNQIKVDTPFHFGPAVFDLLTTEPLLDVVEQLIGPELTSNPIQHVRIKPPATALAEDETRSHITFTDWHQDRGVTHAEADQTEMITVWIAMTDATPQNGCLQVQAQAQDQQMLPHCPRTQTGIAEGFIDESAGLPLPVRSGGVILFDPLTPHASLPNTTDGFRWSFDIRFNKTGQPTGRAHFPSFVARSRANPASELRDWRAWKRMWEEARTRLAGAPHIEIHRWTSDAPHCA
ncbi:MAG: phytanoyl-CoA dioxygenase [Sulfitobacter sp.]|nr:phytanoyl-CoA dioxygenase [Sulfitobacter sp.]